ncbi:MAG: NAD(P)H-dependent oxidoreductase [Sporomusaceae bacterium]|jgi:multimeric flavodoxin WrbA|nr:NAD(P)H-dependent oxidoreductase [Sporomusaceae bacterium]
MLLGDRKSKQEGQGAILQNLLAKAGHQVDSLTLNREELKPCTGCFNCWLKTPGRCVITNDAANNISAQVVCADAVVLLSEITYGSCSADTKAWLDRVIPNALPYMEMYQGELHHKKRYKRLPLWIMAGYGQASGSEKSIFVKFVERNMLNLQQKKYLALVVENNAALTEETSAILRFLGEVGA